jgi:hypothetical protein
LYPSQSDIAVPADKDAREWGEMIVCNATVPGHAANTGDPVAGAWYIQAFCSIVAEHAW